MNLPEKYKKQMKELLGVDYDAYLEALQKHSYAGLRVNTLKITTEEFEKISPFQMKKIPWTKNGYYYDLQSQPAKHPYYYAGLYYIQEPTAMLPAEILPVSPGEKVLDLCAAPGGKSTELAAKLRGKGVLVSNDISNSRAKGLLKNIELFGISNAIVLSESPEKLCSYFNEYFDKILVDAPCSGEGMFRKDPSMVNDWEEKGPDYYSEIQKNIIMAASEMLKPGGMMLYSTCTFSPKENEATIQYLLDRCPEFKVVPVEKYKEFDCGKPEWVNGAPELKNCIRIWPQKVNGEGHFAALLEKQGEKQEKQMEYQLQEVKISDETISFFKKVKTSLPKERIHRQEGKLYLLPEGVVSLKGLRVLRSGLFLGEEKKRRFEPGQALANALFADEYPDTLHMKGDDPAVIRYLKGETIELEDESAKGMMLVNVDGFPLGWGKADRGVLKNKYYAGWRWM